MESIDKSIAYPFHGILVHESGQNGVSLRVEQQIRCTIVVDFIPTSRFQERAMSIFSSLFKPKPYSSADGKEVDSLMEELVRIGIKEDYLSETPGRGYNGQCRHIRTREIGKRLHEIGGNDLMSWAYGIVRKKAGKTPASHLEYAWIDIGSWQP